MNLKYGISYGSAIKDYSNISEVLGMEVSFLEIPLSQQEDIDKIIEFAIKFNFGLAAHIPSQNLINKLPFILSFDEPRQITGYLELVDACLDCYANYKYLVAHFPVHCYCSPEKNLMLNELYLAGLQQICREFGLPLLLENVVITDTICLPEHYSKYLNSEVKLCYDIGHAHTLRSVLPQMPKMDYVSGFFIHHRENIKAIHLYNVSSASFMDSKVHLPLISEPINRPELMSYSDVAARIKELPTLEYIIFEPHREVYLDYGTIGDII